MLEMDTAEIAKVMNYPCGVSPIMKRLVKKVKKN